MRVVAVLDLKGGQAVHAVAGHRSQYRPLASIFHPEPDPVALAAGLRDRLGLTGIYLADLDAIAGCAEPAWKTLQGITRLGLHVWADIGINSRSQAGRLDAVGVQTVVVGLESSPGPDLLAAIVARVGADRVVWSLDLRAGVPIVRANHGWGGDSTDAANLTAQAVAAGVRRIVRLDLATVGTGQGVTLIPPAPSTWPGVEWSTGGGVASVADLTALADRGYGVALVGSALHDGRIRRADLDRLQ